MAVSVGRRCGLGGVLLALFAAGAAGALVFDPAQTAAIFEAAGFVAKGERYVRCEEDPPTLSYRAGHIEPADLNGDGRPEAWVKEGSVFCYGSTAEFFVLLARDEDGGWAILLESAGIPVALETRHHGWPDIEIGGPGLGPFPIYRFDGKVYVRR